MVAPYTLIGLLIGCLALELPWQTHGQFWKNSQNQHQSWEREMIALRDSGICYKTQVVETLNPELRQRQISYCCDGYRNRGTSKILKCEPICEEDCSNGVCIAPGNCECAPGFYRELARCRIYGD
ncbi:hypothetical protein KR215_007058 [Drosophila sulfurigaster]|uniref:Cell death abnormality protein 1 n=1 Tax=Drosophila albomicans TaxID=7291 RepID=A0A6P8WMD1_DROAB|nr:cell death abnormality protein 1 [Drosophila albomicans]XP_060651408.1 cell death abnormality protein 1 [Drosophila nasuta]XP_062121011.1 cell death abnormality protein 1 [Drosophila sulfurigaster albostrigata]KAH8393081.1 hypothetical protein KR215_007058 [Drosophila sulfurigaster]